MNKGTKKVFVGVSCNIEDTVTAPEIVTSKNIISELPSTIAGSSVNVARLLHRLGASVTKLFTTAGDDIYAEFVHKTLTEWGLDYLILPIREATARSIVVVQKGNKNKSTIYGHKPDYISSKVAQGKQVLVDQIDIYQPDFILATGVSPMDIELVEAMFCVNRGIKVFNPSYNLIADAQAFMNLLKMVDMLFVNHEEVCKFLNKPASEFEPTLDIEKFCRIVDVKEVVVTNNSHGAYHCDKDNDYKLLHQPTTPCQVVDPTGAGDAFLAGFIYSRIMGGLTKDSMKLASAVATLNIQKVGGSAIPTDEEIKQLLK